jgi:pimeloyl-ACP methyl ester carboxylesterase
MGEDDLAQTFGTMQQVGAAAADGRLVDAVSAFAPWIGTDEEIAALERTNFFERWAGAVPAMLRFVQQDAAYEGVRSTDPDELARIAVPVLLLRGEQTRLGTFFADAAQSSPGTSPSRRSASCRASGTLCRCLNRSPSPTN